MKTVYPCLNFDGNAREAFDYYRTVFGGSFQAVMYFREMEGISQLPDDERDRIAHISLPIGNSVLIAADSLPSYMDKPLVVGNNFYVTVEPESGEEADRIFAMLSDGGAVEMPLGRTEWAEKFGVCADKFGIQWMINYDGDVSWEAPHRAETAA